MTLTKRILCLAPILSVYFVSGQNVGIGTTNPKSRLHVADSTVVFSATGDIPFDAGNTPVNGNGRRMLWYADKAAFRAGYAISNEWDKNNIGNYSVALGYGSIANNVGTSAIGFQANASGVYSISIGYQTNAKALASLAVGHNNDISDNPDPNNPLLTDRIFQIGNGDFSGNRGNAMTVLRNGNVGIGTLTPANRLQIGANGVLRIDGPSASGGVQPSFSIGGFGDLQVDAFGTVGGRFIVKENGNVGITNSNPGFPLAIGGPVGDKISLGGSGSGHYGFGTNSNLLIIHSGLSGSDIAFGYGAVATFVEKFRMKGNGAFVVNGDAGTAGEVLQSTGPSSSPVWVTSVYNNTIQISPGSSTPISTDGVWTPLTGMTYTFSTSGNAKVLVFCNVEASPGFCVSCGSTVFHIGVFVDGTLTLNVTNDVANQSFLTFSGNYLASVAAGSHTIDIRAQKTGPSAFFFSHNMILQIIPQ